MTSKSQRNEEAVQEKGLEVWRDPSKKRDKSKVIEPSCNPPLSGRATGEEGEGSDTSQLDEKIIGVEAGLSALKRRVIVVEKNFSSLEVVALEGLDDVKNTWWSLRKFTKSV